MGFRSPQSDVCLWVVIGLPWVRWSWLVMGCRGWGGRGSPWVVLACYGSVGFDGLAGLDSMVVGLASVVIGLV